MSIQVPTFPLEKFCMRSVEHQKNGFPIEGFERLFSLESRNFWFIARNELLVWAARRYSADFESFLEVGCGTGFVLSAFVRAFPGRRFVGTELFSEGLKFAEKRLPNIELVELNVLDSAYIGEFDVVAAFDVIEHIEDDSGALKALYAALKPGGYCFVTVPQHRWLWSATDEAAHHHRRYTAAELHKKVRDSSFDVVRSSSFVSFLVPLMWVSRFLASSGKDRGALDELNLHPLLNRIFLAMLRLENRLIQWGFNFPIGGSRLMILRRLN